MPNYDEFKKKAKDAFDSFADYDRASADAQIPTHEETDDVSIDTHVLLEVSEPEPLMAYPSSPDRPVICQATALPETAYSIRPGLCTLEELESEATNDDETYDAPLVPDEYGLVWRVMPTLDYRFIHFCFCDMFLDGGINGREIDRETGLLTDYYHGCHCSQGYYIVSFVYDPERGLFGHPAHYNSAGFSAACGMHPFDEAFDRFDWYIADSLHHVQLVDSSKREYFTDIGSQWLGSHDFVTRHGHYPWRLTPEAFSGVFAVMYNGELVTDFIFDGRSSRAGVNRWSSSTRPHFSTINMRFDGRWGLVDRLGNTAVPFLYDRVSAICYDVAIAVYNNVYGLVDIEGNTIAPFIFDRILNIDAYTVFARYNGMYGILDVRQTRLIANKGADI